MKNLHLGISIDGAGRHPAAWRQPGAAAASLFTADHAVALAKLAERACLDYVSLDDTFALQPGGQSVVRGQLDALLTLARVAPATSRIGLLPTVTTTFTEPFHVSKNLATLDFVSLGRAGWLVDVSRGADEARQFGRRRLDADDLDGELQAEAAEAIDVARRLWDSWEDGAVIRDVATGRYIDRDRLHYVDFEGRFFSVRGPSITPRSPQAHPLVAVRAATPAALQVGAASADIVLIDAGSAEAARDLREQVFAAARAGGRDTSTIFVLAVVDVLLGDTAIAAQQVRAELDALVPATPATTLDFVGTADELAVLFDEWSSSAGLDGFHIRPALLPDTLQRVADDVVPKLRERGRFRTEYAGTMLRDHFGLARPANRYAAAGGA